MKSEKSFSELPVELRNVARALMEDLVRHGEQNSGFSLQVVSHLLRVNRSSLATLKANITRNAIRNK